MNNIKLIREKLNMTQAALAGALGCTQGNISFYEQGQTVPPQVAKLLIAHAKAIGHEVTFDDIYTEQVSVKAAA